MASNLRKSKLESLLQGTIAKFLIEHQSDFDIPVIVLVDKVMMAPDLKSAVVWLGFSPSDVDRDKKYFEKVMLHSKNIQSYLFKAMHIRRAPQIFLKLSDTENAFKLEKIFDTLKSHDRDKNQTNSNGIEEDSTDSSS